jgi:hypothetical protein
VKLTKEQVKAMFGGKWPETPCGFCFDAVSHFVVLDGLIYCWLGGGPIGPTLQLTVLP